MVVLFTPLHKDSLPGNKNEAAVVIAKVAILSANETLFEVCQQPMTMYFGLTVTEVAAGQDHRIKTTQRTLPVRSMLAYFTCRQSAWSRPRYST